MPPQPVNPSKAKATSPQDHKSLTESNIIRKKDRRSQRKNLRIRMFRKRAANPPTVTCDDPYVDYKLTIKLLMSNSKKEVKEGRGRNYSFSSNHNEHFDSAEERLLREPLRETDIIRNYSPSRFEAECFMRATAANPPLEPISPSLIVHQEDEIRKLEEVIYYLTGDRDILKEECASLHMELGVITVSFGKEKEAFEADIRKLKEIIKDKESECLSLAKNLRKEKEIFEQEHERLNYQLKSTIEKKTDEIYAISREKQMENQETKRNLEAIIEELKTSHKQELSQKAAIVPTLFSQIDSWKARYDSLEKELASSDEQREEEKLKIREEHEIFVSDIKEGYHRTKMQIMDAAKEVAKALEDNSEIQRSAFLIEIEHLRQLLFKYLGQNQEIGAIIFEANREHQAQMNGYLDLIKELQAKLSVVHSQKQKQLQFLKIKFANLHSADLQSAQELFNIKISHLVEQLQIAEAQKSRLKQMIDHQKAKSRRLIDEFKQRDSRFHQQLYALRLKNSQDLDEIQQKYQKQKSAIAQKTQQTLRESQASLNKIGFHEEQLKKLRKLLDNKTKEAEQFQKQVRKLKADVNTVRNKAANDANAREMAWNEERQALRHQIATKNKEIQKFNNSILEAANEQSRFDYSPLEKEIKVLRENLKARTDEGKGWKERAEELKANVDELNLQKQRLRTEISRQSQESQVLWDQRAKEKAKDIQKFYERKIQFILLQKQQILGQGQQQSEKYNNLNAKYIQLDNAYHELLSKLEKRSQLQQKIVQLGLDTNLIKNKQQLFEY